MSTLSFDTFNGGLDVRKSASSAGANQLRLLSNAFINSGGEIEGRPCWRKIKTLEPGTFGLGAALGQLVTYTNTQGFAHGDPLFNALYVPHPSNATALPVKAWFCDVFRGLPYVAIEYSNGDVYHHYMDPGSNDSPTWAATTVIALGQFRTPTVPNGLRYEATSIGAAPNQTGGAEPTWPLALATSVVDGNITWTARAFDIKDANCPHGKIALKIEDKVFSSKDKDVRFCATAAARDWTTSSDAGFISAGSRQPGSSTVTALSSFGGSAAIFFADGIQVWSYDPDPANMTLQYRVRNVGTQFPYAIGEIGGDTLFQNYYGIRSIGLNLLTVTVQDADVGAPIQKLVGKTVPLGADPRCVYFSRTGELWFWYQDVAWVYTFSRITKSASWSYAKWGFVPDAVVQLGEEVYARKDNDIYVADLDCYQDGDVTPTVEVLWPYQDFKRPGVEKTFQGADAVVTGTAEISWLWNPNDETAETDAVAFEGNTEYGPGIPVELMTTSLAWRVKHQANEKFVFSKLVLYYD